MDTAVATRPSAADLLALAKPGITRMIVFTTGVGLFLAPGPVDAATVILTLVGTAIVVGAANILNSYLERDVDGLMSRTRDRPLPDGRVEPETALWMGAALSMVGVPLLVFGVNALTGLLAAMALFSYVMVYTPMKRLSPTSTLVGALPGALPALMGWTAATGRIGLPGLVLFAIVFFWQMPHFLAIGVFRLDDYARAGFRILPVVASERRTRFHMLVWTAGLVPVSLLLHPLGAAGWIYLGGSLLVGGWFLYRVARLSLTGGPGWARGAFHASLIYLTGLYAFIFLDALPGMLG